MLAASSRVAATPIPAEYGQRPVAASPLSVMQVLVACATSRSFASRTSHSTRPTVRPAETTRPSARSLPVHTGFVKLILSSSVVNVSPSPRRARSEEHTSELQSRVDLVCRLLLEKKKKTNTHLL